jgi:hypothetical protein
MVNEFSTVMLAERWILLEIRGSARFSKPRAKGCHVAEVTPAELRRLGNLGLIRVRMTADYRLSRSRIPNDPLLA